MVPGARHRQPSLGPESAPRRPRRHPAGGGAPRARLARRRVLRPALFPPLRRPDQQPTLSNLRLLRLPFGKDGALNGDPAKTNWTHSCGLPIRICTNLISFPSLTQLMSISTFLSFSNSARYRARPNSPSRTDLSLITSPRFTNLPY